MRSMAKCPPSGVNAGVQGPIAGQSKRSTMGTYFDSQGIMRTAQPYELRPNYVYKNGVWVQQGYLREGQSTNNVQVSYYNNYNVNGETCSRAWAGAGYSVTLQPKGVNGNPVFIWGMPGGGVVSFFVRCDDISLLTIGNFGSNAPMQYGKNLYRFYTDDATRQPVFYNQSTSGLYLEYGWFQAEAGNVPTSWVPFSQTRSAD